jgi:hypothetical protein
MGLTLQLGARSRTIPTHTMQSFSLDLGSQSPTPTQWMAVVVMGILTVFYLFFFRKKKKDPLDKAPSFASLAQQRNVERQMQNLLVELSEMTRQITAQLDTRTQKLTMLMEDADQKIAQLQQLVKSRQLPTNIETFVEPAPSKREPEQLPVFKPKEPKEPEADREHQDVYTLADQGRSAPEIARALNRPRGEVDLILALRAHV